MSNLPINKLPQFNTNINESNFLNYTNKTDQIETQRIKFFGYSSDDSYNQQNILLTRDNLKKEHDIRLEQYNYFNNPLHFSEADTEKLSNELKAIRTIISFEHGDKDAFTEIAKLTDDGDSNSNISVNDFLAVCALDGEDISFSTKDIELLFEDKSPNKLIDSPSLEIKYLPDGIWDRDKYGWWFSQWKTQPNTKQIFNNEMNDIQNGTNKDIKNQLKKLHTPDQHDIGPTAPIQKKPQEDDIVPDKPANNLPIQKMNEGEYNDQYLEYFEEPVEPKIIPTDTSPI